MNYINTLLCHQPYVIIRNLMHTIMMTASSADVTDVIIGGNILMNNRAFTSLDEERILYEGKMQMKKMLSRI